MVPTIGRRMYFYCNEQTRAQSNLFSLDTSMPFDAGVIYVTPGGSSVHVAVTSHLGRVVNFCSVPVVTESEDHDHPYWVEWMPYQKEQAAKAEATAKATAEENQLGIICQTVVELTKLRIAETPQLSIENFALEVLRKLLTEVKTSLS